MANTWKDVTPNYGLDVYDINTPLSDDVTGEQFFASLANMTNSNTTKIDTALGNASLKPDVATIGNIGTFDANRNLVDSGRVISNVLGTTNNEVPTSKAVRDSLGETDAKIITERDRAITEENALATNLQSEITRAKDAEATKIGRDEFTANNYNRIVTAVNVGANTTDRTLQVNTYNPNTKTTNTVTNAIPRVNTTIAGTMAPETLVEHNNIKSYIPTQASATNQLADKAFVNSTIQNMVANHVTATAAGEPFATRAALLAATTFYYRGIVYTPSNHDYTVITADEGAPSPFTNGQTRWEYDGTKWVYLYGVNERPFTAAQTAALDSGITSALVTKINDIDNKLDKTGKAADSSLLNGKADTSFATAEQGAKADAAYSPSNPPPASGGANIPYISSTTGTNDYIATLSNYTSHTAGQIIVVKFSTTNTGASTININSLGAVTIVRGASTALIAGEIEANAEHELIYGGTNFHLISVAGIVSKANSANTATSANTALSATTATNAGYATSAGTAGSAGYWTTARSLTLSGAVYGTATIQGNANVSLSTSFTGALAGTMKTIHVINRSVTASEFSGGSINIALSVSVPSKCVPVLYCSSQYGVAGGSPSNLSILGTTVYNSYVNVNTFPAGAGIYSYNSGMIRGYVIEFN